MATANVRRLLGPAVLMGGGLALVGAAGYGFVALAGHTLPAGDAAAVASLYMLVNIIGPGLFVALEQETNRSTSAQLTAGNGARGVVRRASILAVLMLAVVVVVLGALSPVLVDRALRGHWGLFGAVLIGAVTAAAIYLVRGLLGGMQRFTGYAATLALEGIGRLVPCLAIAFSGAANAVAYALVFGAGSAFGALAGLPWLRHPDRRPAGVEPAVEPVLPPEPGTALAGSSVALMARAMSLLVGATLLTQLVANLAPIVVTSRLTADAVTASAFASAWVLVRIPLFLFAPVQAMLLPVLTRAATVGDLAGVRAKLRLILIAVAAVGVPGVLASATVGPWAVQVLFGAHVRLSNVLLGLLGVTTVALMIAQVLQPGLVALGRHRAAMLSWVIGSVVLVPLLALPGDPLRAAVIAQLAGSALVVAAMVVTLVGALRAPGAARAVPEPAHR